MSNNWHTSLFCRGWSPSDRQFVTYLRYYTCRILSLKASACSIGQSTNSDPLIRRRCIVGNWQELLFMIMFVKSLCMGGKHIGNSQYFKLKGVRAFSCCKKSPKQHNLYMFHGCLFMNDYIYCIGIRWAGKRPPKYNAHQWNIKRSQLKQCIFSLPIQILTIDELATLCFGR